MNSTTILCSDMAGEKQHILSPTGCRFHSHRKENDMEILRIIFPALMVVGALGSLIVNIVEKGNYAISIQWIGAALLYTALMLRNMTK